MNRKVFAYLLLIIILVGFFYGFSQIFSNTETRITGRAIVNYADSSEDLKIIPVRAHIVKDDSGYYTSSRNEENIVKTMGEVNRIWKQGEIYFQIEKIIETELDFRAIPNAINGEYSGLFKSENYEDEMINIFFTQSLNGLNGIALFETDSILISDFTTVNDFRTTAHELGHLLGLKHVDSADKLMARGKNGEILEGWEIKIAKSNSFDFQR